MNAKSLYTWCKLHSAGLIIQQTICSNTCRYIAMFGCHRLFSNFSRWLHSVGPLVTPGETLCIVFLVKCIFLYWTEGWRWNLHCSRGGFRPCRTCGYRSPSTCLCCYCPGNEEFGAVYIQCDEGKSFSTPVIIWAGCEHLLIPYPL